MSLRALVGKGGRKPPKRVTRPKPARPEEQVWELLQRQRQTIPFPVEPQAFLDSLIPGQVAVDAVQAQIDNLGKTMQVASVGQCVYVSVGEPGSSYDTIFHVRAARVCPAPVIVTDPFVMWEQHPHFAAVSAWFDSAVKMATRLDELKMMIEAYFSSVATAADMRASWPEMQKFVRLPGPLMGHVTALRREGLDILMQEEVKPKARKEVITLLTAATLLEPVTPVAWVSLID